jgi:hypothetical protein
VRGNRDSSHRTRSIVARTSGALGSNPSARRAWACSSSISSWTCHPVVRFKRSPQSVRNASAVGSVGSGKLREMRASDLAFPVEPSQLAVTNAQAGSSISYLSNSLLVRPFPGARPRGSPGPYSFYLIPMTTRPVLPRIFHGGYAASLNTYSDLRLYWCAILGLNQ